jgi:hypothetical protein
MGIIGTLNYGKEKTSHDMAHIYIAVFQFKDHHWKTRKNGLKRPWMISSTPASKVLVEKGYA